MEEIETSFKGLLQLNFEKDSKEIGADPISTNSFGMWTKP
jgi:hypothetical protein